MEMVSEVEMTETMFERLRQNSPKLLRFLRVSVVNRL